MDTARSSFMLPTRLRRLRLNPQLRAMVRETHLSIHDFIQPLFVHHSPTLSQPIEGLPDENQRLSLDQLEEQVQHLASLGIRGILLFGIPSHKDAEGTCARDPESLIPQAIRLIKRTAPQLLLITDICYCAYTDHGHCGALTQQHGEYTVDNDATLPWLAEQAICHVRAGADMVAPSGMIDGMVAAIRSGLDQAEFSHIPILSYAIKYCSTFYQTFRHATQGAPQGHRQGYQIDPAQSEIALREASLDVAEGADLLMIKPAHTYLDIIYRIHQLCTGVPIVAYHVSGECALIKAAAQQGWIDEKKAVLEVLLAMKRAGAHIIISYYTQRLAAQGWLNDA